MPFRAKLPNLAQGVSRQSPAFKEFHRPDDQVNYYPHPVMGLMDRPPSQFIATPSPAQDASEEASWHFVSMREDEQYLVVIEEDGIRVWGVDGTEYQVELAAGADYDYLTLATAQENPYQTLSAKDFTYILNKTKVVTTSGDISDAEEVGIDADDEVFPAGDGRYWVWVRQAGYDAIFDVYAVSKNGSDDTVDWRVVALTWNGANTNSAFLNPATSEQVAHQLHWGGGVYRGFVNNDRVTSLASINTALGRRDGHQTATHLALVENPDDTGGWSTSGNDAFVHFSGTGILDAGRIGSVVEMTHKSGWFFEELPQAVSSLGSQSIVMIGRQVDSLSDLPSEGFDGKKVIVDADPEAGSPVAYYIFEVEEPDTSNGNSGRGIWRETYGFGVDLGLDPDTMPHGLTRKIDGDGSVTGTPGSIYFEFGAIEWGGRLCGDEDSAPLPSFVGQTIRHLFFYRNRLGCLSNDNIVFSEVGEFANFFRTTVESYPTTDPIDARSNSRKIREFSHTFEIQGRLMIRAEDVVMEVGDSDTVLSAETIQIRPVLDIHTDTLAEPVTLESSVLLTDRLQRFTQVVEIVPSGDTRFQSIRVTDEVLDLIEPRIRYMTASPTLGLAALVPTNSGTIYLYSYLWNGPQEKLQSAWWTMTSGAEDTIRFASFFEDTLYLVVERLGKVFFTKIVFDMPKQASDGWEILCDCRVPLDDVMITMAGPDSVIAMPYPISDQDFFYIVYDGQGSEPKGSRVNEAVNPVTISEVDEEITVSGIDLTSAKGYIGIRYARTFTFGEFRPKAVASNRGRVALASAEVLLQELVLNYRDTVQFSVDTLNRRSYSQVFSTVLPSADPPLATGSKRFNLFGEASRTTITIQNSSPRPSIIQSGEIVFSLRVKGQESFL